MFPKREGSVGKVAVLCFSPNSGGMEHDAAAMAIKINKNVSDCLLVVRKYTWLEDFAINNEIPHEAIDFRGNFSIKAISSLRRIWEDYKVENIIFFGASEIKSIHFSVSSEIKSFIVRHATTKSSSKKDLFHRLTWSRVTAHWCISEHLEKNVRDLFPIGRAKVFVNYPGLGEKLSYLPRALPLTPEDKCLYLAHVGRLVVGKGQRDALEVIKILRRRSVPVCLTCYGDGEDRSELESRIIASGLQEVVTLAGYTPQPYKNFGNFHGVLFPSYGEGFGNAFLEALAAGMHCFSYDNTVFPEFKRLGLEFCLVEDRNPEALASAIEEVWEQRIPSPFKNIERCQSLFSEETEMKILKGYLA
ncbi:glycosyltransferase [Halomonas mongoliensis]|uniref:glycosyltransferase n=1 Tax=Halomonas mongoliensis TaxID=321265 RepID=UPI00403AB76F